MSFVFAPAAPSRCRAGSADRYPVRRVYCVGRNYAAHAREMGFDPDREPPFFFCKPADAVVPVAEGETLSCPTRPRPQTCTMKSSWSPPSARAANIAVENALDHVWGYAVGLDMTRRDLQMKMREAGRPWSWARPSTRARRSARCARRRAARHRPRRHLAAGQRPRQAAQRHRQAHLVGGRDRGLPVEVLPSGSRRPDLYRHPRRRGPGGARRPHDRRRRRPGHAQRAHGLRPSAKSRPCNCTTSSTARPRTACIALALKGCPTNTCR